MNIVERLQSRPEIYKWVVICIVMIGSLMSALDISIVNVSIPSMMSDLGANVEDIQWVVTAYMIAFATLMPLTAWFRDWIGYKNLYLASLLVFTLGSLMCAASWNLPTLIGSRVFQAFGGGAIAPTGMAMITEVFEPHERGKALGVWGFGIILGPAVGPTLGGYLTHTFGWRAIFMVNLPICILGILAGIEFLKKDRPLDSQRKPFDFWGFLFLSTFLVLFLLGLSKGEDKGWTSAYILTCAFIAILSFVFFLLVESTVTHQIIDLSLFKIPVFSICSIIVIIRSIILFGSVFLLPIFLQNQMGYNEIQSGLILLPGALFLAMVMPIGGKLGDSIGPRIPVFIGLAGLGLYMFMYRNIDITMSVFDIIKPMLVRGLGMGLLMAPIMAAALNAVSRRKAGMVAAILSIFMQVGGSLGVASLTTLLTNRIHFHLGILGSSLDSSSSAFQNAYNNVFHQAHTLGYTYAQSRLVSKVVLAQKVFDTASIRAYQDVFFISGLFAFFSLVLVIWLPGRSAVHANPNADGKNIK